MSRDESMDWFHGRLSRAEAEEILHKGKLKELEKKICVFF